MNIISLSRDVDVDEDMVDFLINRVEELSYFVWAENSIQAIHSGTHLEIVSYLSNKDINNFRISAFDKETQFPFDAIPAKSWLKQLTV